MYEFLEFFKAGVQYVFFPVDELTFILGHYQTILISGSSINFGSNATFNGGLMGDFFTLEIEGVNPFSQEIFGENISEMPKVTIGAPCPPKWHALTKFGGAVMSKYPKILIRNWDDFIVRIGSTESTQLPDID